jgi:hypothetical protein
MNEDERWEWREEEKGRIGGVEEERRRTEEENGGKSIV